MAVEVLARGKRSRRRALGQVPRRLLGDAEGVQVMYHALYRIEGGAFDGRLARTSKPLPMSEIIYAHRLNSEIGFLKGKLIKITDAFGRTVLVGS